MKGLEQRCSSVHNSTLAGGREGKQPGHNAGSLWKPSRLHATPTGSPETPPMLSHNLSYELQSENPLPQQISVTHSELC